MRILALAFLICGFLTGTVHGETFQTCAPDSLPGYVVREQSDARLRAIAARVLAKGNQNAEDFSLCEYDGVVPVIVAVIQNNRMVSAVSLPMYVVAFTDTESEGLVAHEIAHVRLFGITKGGVAKEIATDAIAGLWVGKEVVAVGLQRMIAEVGRFPILLQAPLTAEWEYRIRLLRSRDISQQ